MTQVSFATSVAGHQPRRVLITPGYSKLVDRSMFGEEGAVFDRSWTLWPVIFQRLSYLDSFKRVGFPSIVSSSGVGSTGSLRCGLGDSSSYSDASVMLLRRSPS